MLGLALLTILGAGQATSAAPTIPYRTPVQRFSKHLIGTKPHLKSRGLPSACTGRRMPA